VGDLKPLTARRFGQYPSCGSQLVSFPSHVSINILVLSQPIPVVSTSSPKLVSILKRVTSSSKSVHSNTASPVEVVSDSCGCFLKVEKKCGKHRSIHKCSDKEVSAPSSSANEGVNIETVDKSVKFRLKMSKDKPKKKNLIRVTPRNQSQ